MSAHCSNFNALSENWDVNFKARGFSGDGNLGNLKVFFILWFLNLKFQVFQIQDFHPFSIFIFLTLLLLLLPSPSANFHSNSRWLSWEMSYDNYENVICIIKRQQWRDKFQKLWRDFQALKFKLFWLAFHSLVFLINCSRNFI